jgi:uncharacterized protein (TIGR02611 family)
VDRIKRHSKKAAVGIVGGVVLLVGIVLIPYPGPGWVIVFAGLAILASEFSFAERVLDKTRGVYDAWSDWLKEKPQIVQALILLGTGLVVGVTVWFVNGFGLINNFLNLGQDWLISPLFR